jgi:hypothetical protein
MIFQNALFLVTTVSLPTNLYIFATVFEDDYVQQIRKQKLKVENHKV